MIHSIVKVFDVLFLNGVSLVGRSLRRRKEVLRSLFRPIDGRLEFAESFEAKSSSEVQEALLRVIETK